MKSFTIKKSAVPVKLDAGWDSEMWAGANEVKVDFGFDRNSDHTPDVRIKMLHDGENICGLFRVEDRYIIARAQKDQDMVCQDSCVEFFVQPKDSEYYFNFEMNCIGTMLASKKMSRFDAGHFGPDKMHIIRNFGSLPHETIDIQSAGQEWWRVALIPFSVLDIDAVPATLRCNFYKCGDNCAIPHYLSWAPIDTPAPNFHCPEFFGEITLTR